MLGVLEEYWKSNPDIFKLALLEHCEIAVIVYISDKERQISFRFVFLLWYLIM